ncbi:MAG: CocE/NonD family hydrolase [Actinobacteria bacterium]|nr:CocE/NonD family hydrolase [Actinomycetota bacterium]
MPTSGEGGSIVSSPQRLLAWPTVVLCAVALISPITSAAAQSTPPGIVVENGVTQPIYDFNDAIEQTLWVETSLDTDSNGVPDRVMFQVSRPRETETAGLKVPVVMEASPYRSGTWGAVPYHDDYRTIDELPQSYIRHAAEVARGSRADLPTNLDNYYVPRGYGVVIAQSVGTAQSDGCPTIGDYAETESAKTIIDWLNGRARAYDARVGGNEVFADWTTGDVGMTGGSYNGTIPNQVATTGVDGLKTIVPIVAISDWYNYYRENGLVVAPGTFQGEDADVLFGFVAGQARAQGDCADEMAAMTEVQDRITGDYNAFWDARNYLPKAKHIKASVFVVDGRNDWNVKPSQWGQWWDELTHYKIPRKIWLHNGGHGAPAATSSYTLPSGQTWTYQQTVHRWFDHWLWGVDNGIMDEPPAVVQRENNANTIHDDWPDPTMEPVRVNLTADAADQSGGLTTEHVVAPQQAKQTFIDEGREVGSTQNRPGIPMLMASPDGATGQRLVYRSEPLTRPVRLSGTPRIRLRASVDNRSAANLTAYLVDYAAEGTAGLETCPTTACTMVTRGWMDVQNRNRRDKTDPIMHGKSYDFEWNLHPDDYVFEAGRRIGLVVFSTDSGNRNSPNPDNWGFTMLPLPGTQLSVLPGYSHISLPIVGGQAALGF